MQARGLAPADVVAAVNTQNLILPSGTVKIGDTEFSVRMNASPDAIAGLNDLPVRTQAGATTYLSDVAQVRDGFSPQTNIVRQDGERGVLLSVLKNAGVSTLDIVANMRAMLPRASAILPPDIKVTPLFDQSVFVKAAVTGVVIEALIAAALTALMVLLFLGNWRSTAIIALTIPLSLLASILRLYALGETLNIMTLGGLALSVGILVDQAIVTIENIERHLHRGAALHDAIIVGAGEIGVPAFVATVCICIVFVPMFFLTGVARFLFVPMAMAVVFAMIASYILSRTLVPTLVMLLMGGVARRLRRRRAPSPLQRVYKRFDARFERVRAAYALTLVGAARKAQALRARASSASPCCRACSIRCSGATSSRAWTPARSACTSAPPTGTRIEETARIADAIEATIRELIPEGPARDHPRQPRRAEQQHQPLVQQRRHHRHARRRDPDVAAQRARPTEEFVTLLRQRAAEALPRDRVLLPARRHRHADPQLRPARGDRRPVQRAEHAPERGARRRSS